MHLYSVHDGDYTLSCLCIDFISASPISNQYTTFPTGLEHSASDCCARSGMVHDKVEEITSYLMTHTHTLDHC